MMERDTFLGQITSLNNEGAALLERNNCKDGRNAIRLFQRALVASNNLANLPEPPVANDANVAAVTDPTPSTTTSGGRTTTSTNLGDICNFLDVPISTEGRNGLYFFQKGIQIKSSAALKALPKEEAAQICVAIIFTNMALGFHQLCQLYTKQKQQSRTMSSSQVVGDMIQEFFDRSLTFYHQVFHLFSPQPGRVTSNSTATLFLAMAAKNNILWLCFHSLSWASSSPSIAIEQSKQANKDLTWLIQQSQLQPHAANNAATPEPLQEIIQQFYLNTTVLTWTDYFVACPAVAA